ncbi:hypothetical protein V6Z12_A03G127800 [Gossypium hirsutum]
MPKLVLWASYGQCLPATLNTSVLLAMWHFSLLQHSCYGSC